MILLHHPMPLPLHSMYCVTLCKESATTHSLDSSHGLPLLIRHPRLWIPIKSWIVHFVSLSPSFKCIDMLQIVFRSLYPFLFALSNRQAFWFSIRSFPRIPQSRFDVSSRRCENQARYLRIRSQIRAILIFPLHINWIASSWQEYFYLVIRLVT